MNGHSDISTTMNIYAEATENKKKESFKNLEFQIHNMAFRKREKISLIR